LERLSKFFTVNNVGHTVNVVTPWSGDVLETLTVAQLL